MADKKTTDPYANGSIEPYQNGADMWQEYAMQYGLITARVICHSYLNLQAKNPDQGEQIFCSQLREAMAMDRNTIHTPVYLWNRGIAELMGETESYNASMKANELCAGHIDEAIHATVFGDGDSDCHYNLAIAALLDQHGFERVNLVLKCAVWHDTPLGRYPSDLYDWAQDMNKQRPEDTGASEAKRFFAAGGKIMNEHFGNFGIRTRPSALVGLVDELRKKEAEISMDKLPTKETVERLREQYPVGTRIELVSMDDPYNDKLKPGDKGTVESIDDTGTIFAAWDSGSGLGLVYGVDSYKKVEPVLNHDIADSGQELPDGAVRYTIDELIEKMAPQDERDKAVIRECIDGLGVYAAMVAQEGRNTSKVAEIRELISDLVPYWGLDYGEGSKSLDDFLREFDDKVDIALRRGLDADTYEACNAVLTGLARYGEEMVIAQGDSAMGEMLRIGDLMNEVAEYFGYTQEMVFASDSCRWLTNTVAGMLKEYDLPGQAIEGDNVQNYVVKQAVLFEGDRGFAFAHNPEAVSPYVTWHVFNDDGKLNYEWGNYFGSEEKALVDYIDRASKHEYEQGVKEKALPEPPELPEVKQLIRFIDSDYKELFQLPDGDSIRITYPPGDGREPVERSCNFQGEHHFNLEKNGTYHICQFAENMERIGAVYEPVNQLPNVELVSFTPDVGEDKFYTFNREEGNTCAGSVYGDFGNDGERYHSHFNSRDNGLYNAEAQSELQSVIYALRQDLLKDRDSMIAYCQGHPEAKISDGKSSDGREYTGYGFKLETDTRQYFVNCFVQGKDSRFSLFAYADKPAPMLEQDRAAAKDPAGKENRGYTSVLKAIEAGKKEPKPPRKEKIQSQHKNKQDEL